MKTSMIVNRVENWFDTTDVELDECYIAIQLLERLSTRKKMGLEYNRFKIASIIYDRSSSEAVETIDKAIVLLVARNLISFADKNEGKRKLIITDLGLSTFKAYKEEIKNENIQHKC